MYTVRVESKEDMLKIDFSNNETFVLLWYQEEVDPERFFYVEQKTGLRPYMVTFCNDNRMDRKLTVDSIHALYRLFSMYASGELS